MQNRMRAVAALVVLGMSAGAARAVELTGTWSGKIVCKDFNGTSTSKQVVTSQVTITQTGNSFNLQEAGFTYAGKVVSDTAKPTASGQASFILCTTTPTNVALNESGTMTKISVKSGGARFSAVSLFSGAGGTDVGSCKWKYHRASVANPQVPPCS